jgi:hypothetical protein
LSNGQAKQRGTFEQRKAAAIQRNKNLMVAVSKLPRHHPAKTAIRKHGAHRLAVLLTMTGAMQR